MSTISKYVIITPVRDEVRYVEKTISSVTRQTLLPAEWIIVNDGSTDGTGQLLSKLKSQFDWIKVVHRRNRGFRAAGGGVIEAFYEGFSAIGAAHWDFIAKMDGDLSFDPEYFEKCLDHFDSEARLGIAGGTICIVENGQLNIESAGDPRFHVRGAVKIYRRACWDMISPLVKAPGWDTIDEVKANRYGWTTRTFSDLKVTQHKVTGSADGFWSNYFKNGRANYITGYHPIFMLGKCVRRIVQKPFFLVSAALWLGFISGYFMRIPQIQDVATIRYLRRQQLRKMLMSHSIYG